MSTNNDKCSQLLGIKSNIRTNRFKIQKKLRKKKYKKKGLIVFKKYLSFKEYLLVRYFYVKFVKYGKIKGNRILKNFIRELLKLDCYNIFFRDYYLGVKSVEKYKKNW